MQWRWNEHKTEKRSKFQKGRRRSKTIHNGFFACGTPLVSLEPGTLSLFLERLWFPWNLERSRFFGTPLVPLEPGTPLVSLDSQFLSEVRAEYRKVTWPTQKEAMAGTIGVLVVVAVLTTGLSLVDLGLGQLIRLILPS